MRFSTLTLVTAALLVSIVFGQHATTTVPPAPSPARTDAQSSFYAGQAFRDCPECPEMVVIPGGSFTIGSPANEKDRYVDEEPRRQVSIRRFAVGKSDITRGEWAVFVSATKRETPQGCTWTGRTKMEIDPIGSWRGLGFAQDDRHPVVCVTWNDAQDYMHWLSEKTSKKYRLPSESEWEYAARAGTETAYPWGEGASHEYANYGADNWGGLASGRDKWVNASPVGSFPPNAFGLLDMHGNVLQWVQDCFAPDYLALPTDGSAYQKDVQLKTTGDFADMSGTSSYAYRRLRGGDWGDPPMMIRSTARNWAPPSGAKLENYRSGGVGFRVARTLE